MKSSSNSEQIQRGMNARRVSKYIGHTVRRNRSRVPTTETRTSTYRNNKGVVAG